MKKNTPIPYQHKTRAHKVLFEQDSPFRTRTVENKKKQYKRNAKHRNQEG